MRSGSNTPARPPSGNVTLEWHYNGKPWEAARTAPRLTARVREGRDDADDGWLRSLDGSRESTRASTSRSAKEWR